MHKLRTGILLVIQPFIAATHAPFEWIGEGKDFLSSWTSVHQKNEILVRENESLKASIRFLESIQKENMHLRQLLHVKQDKDSSFVSAKVLAYPGRPYLKSALISAGGGDGIKLQQIVVHEKGLVGRVIHVTKNLSYVLLLTDANSHIPVIVRGKDEKGILIGMNDGLPFVKYMNPKNLQVGDIIETSGHGGIFLPEIPVGHITKIEGQTILVEPFCDVERLSFVMLTGPVLNDSIQKLVDHEAFDPA